MPSILLENDTSLSEVSGTHLKWAYTDLTQPIYELELIYVKKSGGAVMSKLLNPSLDKLSLTDLDAGFEYLFTIKVVDNLRVSCQSNVLSAVHPLVIDAPEILGFGGSDNALNITLKPSSAVLTSNDKVEFVLRRGDNIFMVQKPFSSNLIYQLATADNALIVNNYMFKVSCRFVPAETSIYRVPSALSASFDVEPSNKPDAPRNLNLINSSSVSYGWELTWSHPIDFAEWSASGFTVSIITFYNGVLTQNRLLTQGEINALKVVGAGTAPDLFRATLVYSNRFGSGTPAGISEITLYSNPSAPTIYLEMVMDGQIKIRVVDGATNGSNILNYTLYIGQTVVNMSKDIIDGNGGTFTFPGLTNGVNYSIAAIASNIFGSSPSSNVITAMPNKPATLTASVSGKNVLISYNPNGRVIKSLVVLAYDDSLNASEEILRFVNLTSAQMSETLAVLDLTQVMNLSGDIKGCFVVASNDYQTLTYKF